MSNVISIIQGNLGNILFQLAHSITYSRDTNRVLYIKYNDEKARKTFENSRFLKSLGIPIWLGDSTTEDIKILENTNHEFMKVRTDYENENIFIKGYFESEKYFDSTLIRDYFNLSDILSNEVIQKYGITNDDIAVSVRRGDILDLKNIFFVPSRNYYNQVIQDIVKDRTLVISSDDIDWCKKNIEYSNCIYLQESAEVNLALLTLCKNHINSSSTFSWWSSWINEDKESINIFPSKRFVNEQKMKNDSELYIPERWIKYESNFYE